MIEEIQALMPILEKISDGALWAFGIYMLVKVVSIIIWPMAFALIILKGIPAVSKMISATSGVAEIDVTQVKLKGYRTVSYLGEPEQFGEFLRWVGRGQYVHESDLERVMKGADK